jgi:hypothetical protein
VWEAVLVSGWGGREDSCVCERRARDRESQGVGYTQDKQYTQGGQGSPRSACKGTKLAYTNADAIANANASADTPTTAVARA